MENNIEPTETGKKKYPDGIYKGDFYDEKDKDMWKICTCTEKCKENCKGECGCEACRTCYNDWLSLE